MKKVFSEPEIAIIMFEDNDIICASHATTSNNDTNETSINFLEF